MDKFNKVANEGHKEDDLIAKADELGLADDVGLVKMVFMVERRKKLVQYMAAGCCEEFVLEGNTDISPLDDAKRKETMMELLREDGYLWENAATATTYQSLNRGETLFKEETDKDAIIKKSEAFLESLKHNKLVISSFRKSMKDVETTCKQLDKAKERYETQRECMNNGAGESCLNRIVFFVCPMGRDSD